jgi:hypothetical protein
MRADFVLSLSAIECCGSLGKPVRCPFRTCNTREDKDCFEYDGGANGLPGPLVRPKPDGPADVTTARSRAVPDGSF